MSNDDVVDSPKTILPVAVRSSSVSILSLKSQEQRNITRESLENQRDEISNANARTQVLVASKKSAERKRAETKIEICKFSNAISPERFYVGQRVIYVEEGSLWGTTEHVGVIVSTSISHHDKEYKFLKDSDGTTEWLQEHELKCCPMAINQTVFCKHEGKWYQGRIKTVHDSGKAYTVRVVFLISSLYQNVTH